MIRKLAAFAVLAFASVLPSNSEAFWPYAGYGAYNFGWGWNAPTDYVPAPPYFAVHPPVYYSPHITARHYGASPYAWLPGMQPITYVPELVPGRRVMTAIGKSNLMAASSPTRSLEMIENPYFVAQAGAEAPAVQPQPEKIENPHFARR